MLAAPLVVICGGLQIAFDLMLWRAFAKLDTDR